MTKPRSFSDEHGNALPALDPTSPVFQLVALLEYARHRGFRIGPMVRIGDVTVQVQDLRQDEGRGVAPPDVGPWTAAGYPEGDE